MADIYSPWMFGNEEDVTDNGFVTPEFQEMATEAQTEPLENTPEDTTEDSSETDVMTQAFITIQSQTALIDKLVSSLIK